MPYAPEHKAEIRTRILDSARRLFNRNGLAAVSIDEIMAGAGLTRGGFYSYFDSKEELYAEAITHFINGGPNAEWQRMAFADRPEGQALARAILDAYLSRVHLDDMEADAARQRALAVVALCVGGMVLARAVDDEPAADELRVASRRYAVALAGWR